MFNNYKIRKLFTQIENPISYSPLIHQKNLMFKFNIYGQNMLNRFNWDTWTNKKYYGTVHLISSDPLSKQLNARRRRKEVKSFLFFGCLNPQIAYLDWS